MNYHLTIKLMGASHVSSSPLKSLPKASSEPPITDNPLPIKISIKTSTRKTLNLEMEPNDTIKSLRIKVQDIEGPSCSNQRILFEGKRLTDNLTLSECQVQNGSILHLVQRESSTLIFVKGFTGETHCLDVDLYDLVSEVKEKLKEKMKERKSPILKDNLRIMYPAAGKLLEDTKTLCYYNIGEASTLHVVLCTLR